jgi:hypothetical protein
LHQQPCGIVNDFFQSTLAKSTFIVPENEAKESILQIEKAGAKIKTWTIDIANKFFKN